MLLPVGCRLRVRRLSTANSITSSILRCNVAIP
nr:MAG TPA: cysteine-rich protein [Caudoviricetes sp.]